MSSPAKESDTPQNDSTSSSTADEHYDAAVDALMDALRAELKKARPENPAAFVSSFVAKSKASFPTVETCKRIVARHPKALATKPLTIVVFGASGDLAKKKTFPALFGLYCNGLLPLLKDVKEGEIEIDQNSKSTVNASNASRPVVLNIIGFARTEYTQEDFREHLRPLLEQTNPTYKYHVASFLEHVHYVNGDSYSDEKGFRKLQAAIEYHEQWKTLPMKTSCFDAAVEGMQGFKGFRKLFAAKNFDGKQEEEGDAAEQSPVGAEDNTTPPVQKGNRLFYLALPPTAFIDTCAAIRKYLVDCYGPEAAERQAEVARRSLEGPEDFWSRVVVEKPFGHDTKSSNALADALNKLFSEPQIYRIDHYLGKEMVQNIVSLRFANHVFSSVWSANNIHSVQITFKEKIGTEGRGGYFDKFGIIRDVIQNHLCQILALVAMEKPMSLNAEDVRDAKVALLRCVEPVSAKDCVIGQYTAPADGSMKGYKEDEGVPEDSKTPTYAIMRLNIRNDRWAGVPFIIKAGKALEGKSVTVRVQFKEEIRPFTIALPLSDEELAAAEAAGEDPKDPGVRSARVIGPNRNELVIRAQPDEAMYLKINTKNPGLSGDDRAPHTENARSDLTLTELDLTYGSRFNVRIPEAYESLVNEAILGNGTNFVRRDELDASWRIFTPLLHAIDEGRIPVHEYQAGTRGPADGDKLVEASGYRRSHNYIGPKKTKAHH